MKYLVRASLMLATFTLIIINAPSAEARRPCPHGGYCPPGTCVKFNPAAVRLQYACNVKNCSAANCPR
jgi:hypothetical protein